MPNLERVAGISTPSAVDLREYCSPVEDQGEVGSCVANAVVGAIEYHLIRTGAPYSDLSRLFVYYNARRLDETEGRDDGCTRTKAMASILGWGVCREAMWPYQPAMVFTRPTPACYQAADAIKGVQCAITTHGQGVREALTAGLPVAFGMKIPPNLMRYAGEHKHMPAPADGNWEPAPTGHAMLLVGYDDAKNAWLVRNSWGTDWGDGGHFWIDYQVLEKYAGSSSEAPCVIGQIEDSRAFRMAGASLKDMVAGVMAGAPASVAAERASFRQDVATDLQDNLNKARKNIKDRLRGPGVGGGY